MTTPPLERLDVIAKFGQNWDGEGGDAAQAGSVETARMFLSAFELDGAVTLHADGRVMFYPDAKEDAEIIFGNDGEMFMWGADPRGTKRRDAPSDGDAQHARQLPARRSCRSRRG